MLKLARVAGSIPDPLRLQERDKYHTKSQNTHMTPQFLCISEAPLSIPRDISEDPEVS